MNTYTWDIIEIKVEPVVGELQNVVRLINYTCTATSDDALTTSFYGSLAYRTVNELKFVSYEQLTKELLINWLQTTLDTANIYATLDQQIEAQRNTITYIVTTIPV